jgi:hypothetical protein
MRIQLVLESLGTLEREPGRPAVIHRNTIYRMVEGFLDIADFPGETGALPGLFWEEGGAVEPLVPDFYFRTILEVVGREETLTEEQVRRLLERLSTEGGDHGYVSGGKAFMLDEGIDKCTECHREGSPFFFRKVGAAGPLVTREHEVRSAASFMGLDRPYQTLFGLSFRVRPLLKIVLMAAAAILGLIAMLVFVTALGRAAGLIEKRR